MGKKKEPSINDSLITFKDVMKRMSVSDYFYVNHNVFCKTGKMNNIFMSIEDSLWDLIMQDEELKDKFKEVKIDTENGRLVSDALEYCNNTEWISMDNDKMFNNETIKINGVPSERFKYSIDVNKSIFPIRLKKAEYNNFGYKVFSTKKNLVLVISKKFEGVNNSSFSIMRIFYII